MAHLLIADDEPSMRLGLQDNLEFEGYLVQTAASGPEALDRLRQSRFDLLVLDVMMPGMSGFDVLKHLRKSGDTTPVLLLTARGMEMDRVLGLELGADDYLTKPFSLRELLARIKAVLRRTSTTATAPVTFDQAVTIGSLTVDFRRATADRDGMDVPLTHRELELLAYLLAADGRAVSRDELLLKVWGHGEAPTTRTVDNFILRLRKAVEVDPAKPRHILTAHGVGYRLIRNGD